MENYSSFTNSCWLQKGMHEKKIVVECPHLSNRILCFKGISPNTGPPWIQVAIFAASCERKKIQRNKRKTARATCHRLDVAFWNDDDDYDGDDDDDGLENRRLFMTWRRVGQTGNIKIAQTVHRHCVPAGRSVGARICAIRWRLWRGFILFFPCF